MTVKSPVTIVIGASSMSVGVTPFMVCAGSTFILNILLAASERISPPNCKGVCAPNTNGELSIIWILELDIYIGWFVHEMLKQCTFSSYIIVAGKGTDFDPRTSGVFDGTRTLPPAVSVILPNCAPISISVLARTYT